jgi:hypothetical protein
MTSTENVTSHLMTGKCVNKPDQTEPVGCYENLIISNFAKCV